MIIHDNPSGALGCILIAIMVLSIIYFAVTTIHDINREERLEDIKKSLKSKNERGQ